MLVQLISRLLECAPSLIYNSTEAIILGFLNHANLGAECRLRDLEGGFRLPVCFLESCAFVRVGSRNARD